MSGVMLFLAIFRTIKRDMTPRTTEKPFDLVFSAGKASFSPHKRRGRNEFDDSMDHFKWNGVEEIGFVAVMEHQHALGGFLNTPWKELVGLGIPNRETEITLQRKEKYGSEKRRCR